MGGISEEERRRLDYAMQRLHLWAGSLYWEGSSARDQDIRKKYGLGRPSLFGWLWSRGRRHAVYRDGRLLVRRGDLLYEIRGSGEYDRTKLYVVESATSHIPVGAGDGPWSEAVREHIAEFVALFQEIDAREKQAREAKAAAENAAREAELARARKHFGRRNPR